MWVWEKSCPVRRARLGLFLAVGLLGAGAFFLPNAAEAKRVSDYDGQESQSHAIKIPKVRHKGRRIAKHTPTYRWQAVPVHSPSCAETPALPDGNWIPAPVLDDDDDDIVLGDTSANDTE